MPKIVMGISTIPHCKILGDMQTLLVQHQEVTTYNKINTNQESWLHSTEEKV